MRRERKREKERDKERKREERDKERKREKERDKEMKRDIIGCSLLKLTFVTMDISMEINSVRMEKMIVDDMTNLNE